MSESPLQPLHTPVSIIVPSHDGGSQISSADPSSSLPTQTSEENRVPQWAPEAEGSQAQRQSMSSTDSAQLDEQGTTVHELEALRSGEKLHPKDIRSAANKVFTKFKIMTQVRRVNINVCGQFAAGKTSLIANMKNERFLPDRPSTLIATVSHDACLLRNGVLEQTSDTPADFDALADMAEAIPEERKRREEKEEERARQVHEQEARKRHAREEEYRKTRQETLRRQEEQRARLDAARAARAPSPKRKLELAVSRNVTAQEPMIPRLSTHESLPDPVRTTTQAPRETYQLPQRTAKPSIKRKEVPKRPELRMDQLKEKIAADILKDPEITREVGDTETVMSIWDSGGQSVFSSIQHLFMSDRYIIYLLCFNAAERLLSENKQQQYRRPTTNKGKSAHAKDVKDIHVPKHLRNVDHIRHWLTAIHLASGNNDNVPPPPVIIVGTFADQLPEGTDLEGHKEVLWEELQRLCKQSPTFNSMENNHTMAASTSSANTMYLVDNTISGLESEPSPEVTALSDHIHRATEQLLEEELVKKEWVRFEWVLQHLRQQVGVPGYTNRRYLAELAQKVCHINDDEELEEMLLFYDKLRLIIYHPQHKKSGESTASATGYDPEEIIIFNMVWLIDQFNTLIFGPEFTGGNEDKDTTLLRDHLWKTGILRKSLVSRAWPRPQDTDAINDRLLKVFEAWHLVYDCSFESRVEYLVPCALQEPPEHTILERMREGPGVDKPRMVISTADVPLLVVVQPDNLDPLCGGPDDTPLPHSDYFRLLVVLMKKWKIEVGRKKVDLQYNGAWLEPPNGVAGLANFVNGSVRVFLAHYEMSGALLLSVQIQHPVESFEEGYITTRNTKVRISKVLCRVQGDVVSSLRQLYGDKKPAPKLFLVPFPPTCTCREDERLVEMDDRTGVTDAELGYFPWKIPFAGSNPFTGGTGSGQAGDETWPTNDTCHVCGNEVHIPHNAWAWTCPEWKFKLEGNSNKEAKRRLREHRWKFTRPPPPELACDCKLALAQSTPEEQRRQKQVMHCLGQVGFEKEHFANIHEELQTMPLGDRVDKLVKIPKLNTYRSVYTAFDAEAHLQRWQHGPCVAFLQAVCESFASMSKQRRHLEGPVLNARLALPSGPQHLAILPAPVATCTTAPAGSEQSQNYAQEDIMRNIAFTGGMVCSCRHSLTNESEAHHQEMVMRSLSRIGFKQEWLAIIHNNLQQMEQAELVQNLVKIPRIDTHMSLYTLFAAQTRVQQWKHGPCVAFLRAVCEFFVSLSRQPWSLVGPRLGVASSVASDEENDIPDSKSNGETLHEEDARNAVDKMLDTNNGRGEMTKVRRVSLNVCGQFGTGKTSLMDNMKNKKFLLERPSTLVATVSHDACLSQNGVLEQTNKTPADVDAHLDLSKAIAEEKRRREEEEMEEEEERVLNVAEEESEIEPKDALWQHREQLKKLVAAQTGIEPPPKRKPEPVASSSTPTQESIPSRTPQQDLEIDDREKEITKRPELGMDELKKKIVDDIRGNAEIMREVRDKETVMSIWDCGGQSVFSSIQHLFMSDQYVIYLLCFNAAEKLLSEKKQEFHPPASNYNMLADAKDSQKDVEDIPLPGRLRNVDHVRHWLTAIYLASGNNDNVPPPPVIIVGTHADRLPEGTDLQQCKKELWDELRCLCKQSPMFNSMEDNKTMAAFTSSANTMYLVDNTISGLESEPSPEVTALSEHINRAKLQLLEEEVVKKEWVRFEWVLQHLRQQEGFPGYTDRHYLAELAEKICYINDDEELEEMLLFYDKLRLIIYHKQSGEDMASTTGFDPKEIIIFDMVWLIKQFNDLVFGPKFTGAKKEETRTAKLRKHLRETGILGESLVNRAWERSKLELQQDPEINDMLLRLFESWHMLYKCKMNGPVKYLVPCALQVFPERTILGRMREGSDADDDQIVISTADVPLIVVVQPENYDLYDEEPDTPLPSGTYFRLLVRLMEEWRIKDGPQNVDLQYNSAWLELPPWEVGLANFDDGSVHVFLAHYEMSGALLLSVQIQHLRESFEEGHIKTSSTKVRISEVLCRIRGDVVRSLQQLYGEKKPALKLFLVPFPPKCDCSENECHVEIEAAPNQSQSGVKDTDFGYFNWKMPNCGLNPLSGDTRSINPGHQKPWARVRCHQCKCYARPPHNAKAWSCPESEFKLEGKSNEKAKRLLDEHRLKSTATVQDVRRSMTSLSAGAAFVTSSPAGHQSELTDQGAASTSASTSAHTQAATSGTACQDQGGTADVFESPAYKEVRIRLIRSLDMSEVRIMAEGYDLITSTQLDHLSKVFPDRLEHNRELFRMMEVGGKNAIVRFSQLVLAKMGDHYRDGGAKLEQLLS